MIWQIFLEKWSLDPWWMVGSMILFITALSFFLFSFFRHLSTLGWFFIAAVLGGFLFVAFFSSLPTSFEYLASYRPDWSLLYLVKTWTLRSLLTELVFYTVLYAVLGILLVVSLELWALFSFSWGRFRVLLRRAIGQSWFVFFFSFLTLSATRLWASVFDASWESLMNVLLLLFFFFYLQFFLRLLDSARFHVSHLFLEFVYALGFVILLFRFSLDWYFFLVLQEVSIHQLFLGHLFLFFLSILLLGIFATFVIRSFFVSPFFLDHLSRKNSYLLRWTGSFAKTTLYTSGYIFLGVVFSVAVGLLFMVVHEYELYLFEILLFFAGFFVLFYLLDRQEDMRIRGDLVDQRIQSGTHKSFLI